MARIKLTKTAVELAQPQAKAFELRDRGARLPMQDYSNGPPGVHAPVPHELWGAPQARLGPVRSTDRGAGQRHGAGLAGRGSPGRRPRRGQVCRPQGTDHEGVLPHLYGGLLQAAQQT